MQNRIRFASLAALSIVASACAPVESLQQTEAKASTTDLRRALERQGFTVQEGKLVFFRVEDCAPLPNCYGNNPSSPYGLYALPAAPGQQFPADAPAFDPGDGLRTGWRLRPDEAVVFLGRTPPAARYFSFRSYLFDRATRRPGKRKTLFASLGDALNHEVIATSGTRDSRPGDPFDRDTLVITSADRGIDARIRAAAEDAGISRDVMNSDVIPSRLVKMGLEASADVLAMIVRVALFEDPEVGHAYMQRSEATVLRVTPTSRVRLEPHPTPELRQRGTQTDEDHLSGPLLALGRAIKARHRRESARTIPTVLLPVEGFECIEHGRNCLGDVRDTIYAAAPAGKLPRSPRDYLMVYGVNHEATGKAAYSSFAAYDLSKLVGVASVSSDAMRGSAARYLPGHPNADDLYAFKVSRDCRDEAYCMELPVDFPGVPLDASLSIAFRAYLEPGAHVSPDPEELLLSRVLRFSPRRR